MKRFWTSATVAEVAGGFGVRLDDRPLNTPAKRPAVVPARAVALAMAAEWDAVGETVDPLTMPVTRAVNVTLDRVIAARAEVASAIAAYGANDLLCYRAEHPAALVARQTAAWDPLLAWAESIYGATLAVTAGVMHLDQPAEALVRLTSAVEGIDAWGLTPLHELVTLSGSLVIGLAVREGAVDAEAAWAASCVDEAWNIEQWGEDAEAAEQAARRRRAFLDASRLLELLAEG